MRNKLWIPFVYVLLLSICSFKPGNVYSQGFEGILYFKNVEANDQTIEIALMSKFGEDVMEKIYENESGDILPLAKKVFELSTNDLQNASKLEVMEDGYKLTEGKLYVSPNKMRYDGSMEGQNISYFYFVDKNVMFNIFWDQKSYMEIDMEEIKKQTQAVTEKMQEMFGNAEMEEAMEKPKLVKTGRKQTINGYECEEVLAYDEEEAAQVWITKNSSLQNIMEEWENKVGGMFNEGEEESGISSLIEQQDGVPINEKRYDGAMITVEELVKIEKQALDSKLFKVPTGFKKMSMQDMMKFQMK